MTARVSDYVCPCFLKAATLLLVGVSIKEITEKHAASGPNRILVSNVRVDACNACKKATADSRLRVYTWEMCTCNLQETLMTREPLRAFQLNERMQTLVRKCKMFGFIETLSTHTALGCEIVFLKIRSLVQSQVCYKVKAVFKNTSSSPLSVLPQLPFLFSSFSFGPFGFFLLKWDGSKLKQVLVSLQMFIYWLSSSWCNKATRTSCPLPSAEPLLWSASFCLLWHQEFTLESFQRTLTKCKRNH